MLPRERISCDVVSKGPASQHLDVQIGPPSVAGRRLEGEDPFDSCKITRKGTASSNGTANSHGGWGSSLAWNEGGGGGRSSSWWWWQEGPCQALNNATLLGKEGINAWHDAMGYQ